MIFKDLHISFDIPSLKERQNLVQLVKDNGGKITFLSSKVIQFISFILFILGQDYNRSYRNYRVSRLNLTGGEHLKQEIKKV